MKPTVVSHSRRLLGNDTSQSSPSEKGDADLEVLVRVYKALQSQLPRNNFSTYIH